MTGFNPPTEKDLPSSDLSITLSFGPKDPTLSDDPDMDRCFQLDGASSTDVAATGRPRAIPPHLRQKYLERQAMEENKISSSAADNLQASTVSSKPVAPSAIAPSKLTSMSRQPEIEIKINTEFVEQRNEDQAPASAVSEHTLTTIDPDLARPSIEEECISHVGWQPPHFIKTLEPLHSDTPKIPDLIDTITFSWEFLHKTFGGIEWSPGLYYKPHNHGPSILPHRTFYALDARHEPYLPHGPGQHGAKLTAFFNDNPEDGSDDGEGLYQSVPVFIAASTFAGATAPDRYVYFGNFTQSRWSDKIDYDHMLNRIPRSVKMFWAAQLADPSRPEWVTKQLQSHFWPKPEYEGCFPSVAPATGSVAAEEDEEALEEKIQQDVKQYIDELAAWKRDADMKVKLITKEVVLEAFSAPDAADPPGLRLWWEYLECVDWDRGFYDMLVKVQKEAGGD